MTIINNYIIPGVSSEILCETAVGGKIRIFKASRTQMQYVTPHSHRFNITTIVLQGWIRNTVFHHTSNPEEEGAEEYQESVLTYDGVAGEYDCKKLKNKTEYYVAETVKYTQGQIYTMAHHNVHSIAFSKDAEVLIIESPQKEPKSIIIEPVINNKHIHIMEVKDWMFEHQMD